MRSLVVLLAFAASLLSAKRTVTVDLHPLAARGNTLSHEIAAEPAVKKDAGDTSPAIQTLVSPVPRAATLSLFPSLSPLSPSPQNAPIYPDSVAAASISSVEPIDLAASSFSYAPNSVFTTLKRDFFIRSDSLSQENASAPSNEDASQNAASSNGTKFSNEARDSTEAIKLSKEFAAPSDPKFFAEDEPTTDGAEPTETDDPAETTDGPAETTDDPAESTDDPAESTDDPAESTGDPAESTGDPAESTGDPAESTGDPAGSTGDPTDPAMSTAASSSEPKETGSKLVTHNLTATLLVPGEHTEVTLPPSSTDIKLVPVSGAFMAKIQNRWLAMGILASVAAMHT